MVVTVRPLVGTRGTGPGSVFSVIFGIFRVFYWFFGIFRVFTGFSGFPGFPGFSGLSSGGPVVAQWWPSVGPMRPSGGPVWVQ